MSDFIWPITVGVISTIFFVIFREPLATLIKHTKRVGRDGLDADTGHDAPLNPLAPKQESQSDAIAHLREAHLAEIARIEQRHTERYTKDIDPLKRMVATQAQQIVDLASRLKTIESNHVVKRMLAAPPPKTDATQTR